MPLVKDSKIKITYCQDCGRHITDLKDESIKIHFDIEIPGYNTYDCICDQCLSVLKDELHYDDFDPMHPNETREEFHEHEDY